MTETKYPSVYSKKEKSALKLISLLGLLVFAVMVVIDPHRAWGNLLLGNFYFLSLSLSGIVFVAVQYSASGGWPVLFRRIPEAMGGYLPLGGVIAAVLFLGIRTLYPWADPAAVAHDAVLQNKSFLFNTPAFCIRVFIYVGVWYYLAQKIIRNSREQDVTKSIDLTQQNIKYSVIFLVMFGLTFSLAVIDWLLSLEPRWSSTIYPWYVFSGIFVHGIAMVACLLVLLRKRGLFEKINHHHLHDLGKYIFAFSVFWAYLWFSQYLLIWYSNIPEETAYFVERLHGHWKILFWVNPVINFLIPAGILLPVQRKLNPRMLLVAGGFIAIGHWLDLYLMIMPSVIGVRPEFGVPEAGIFIGIFASFLLMFGKSFSEASPIPVHDPFLAESLHHHG